MDLEDRLIIKVQLGEEIRKMPIHNEDITYDELIIMMERVFKHKLNPSNEIIIKYKDEDNDLITISDDSDLTFAIGSSDVLKLVLTVQSDENCTDKIAKELEILDLATIRKELQVIRDQTNSLLDKINHFNNGMVLNAEVSGRTSATYGDYHGVGGKEFDPLSIGNKPNLQSHKRAESSASVGSYLHQDDSIVKPNTEQRQQSPNQVTHVESSENHEQSTTQNAPTSTTYDINGSQMSQNSHASYTSPVNMHPSVTCTPNLSQQFVGPHMAQREMVGHNVPPHNISELNVHPQSIVGQSLPPVSMGGQNMSLQSMGGQNMPPQSMGGQNMPPQSMGGQNMPPQSMGGQNMPPQSMGGQKMPQQNMGGQNMVGHNMPPQNMGGQNMPQQSMGGQNMPPQSMGAQNMPPQSMGGQNMPPQSMGGQNMPPQNMVGQNMPSQSMGGQNMPPQNMVGQSMPPLSMGGQSLQNMGGHNMPPQNMGGQNMPPQSMVGHNMPPQNMGRQNMGGQNVSPQNIGGINMPPSMGGFNPVSHGEGTKLPGYMPTGRAAFYPCQPRPSPNSVNQHIRPIMQPTSPQYFSPQTSVPQGGPMFNPQMQQPQTGPHGYQPN